MEEADRQAILDGEHALVAAQRDADRAAMERLLSPVFREIGQSGRLYARGDVLDALAATPVAGFALQPLAWIEASGDCVILLYESDVTRLQDGRPQRRRALRSSTWRREDGGWRLLFHQGTPLPPA
ncbi:DUF4440 domain-containing protein [Fulvimonas soli]|jgi:hypothetical protein|uniref:DUF4440 domain-containing protein n=1 Tax=Fulvimonas soli TaxID=155197 RepID=A0A316J056_9GAMM|nr:nuclear transport factor 2 family protein [Fulvimonas soli]PWK92885.1 hypothetical protein C7456_101223 [Fulvimonas soli]TNY26606.1 hypothetical protein BV497_07685 [Fulvimonas soli]